MKGESHVLFFPNGGRLVSNLNDTAAKSEALRLGLLPGMLEALGKRAGQRGVAGVARDGDRIVAIIAWEGFKSPSDNGWGSLSISPATEATASMLRASRSDGCGWIARRMAASTPGGPERGCILICPRFPIFGRRAI